MAEAKAIGSTWLSAYKGKDWPVVLTDDKTTPKAFVEAPPDSFSCPAIVLGKLSYIWVNTNKLKPFEPYQDYCSGLPAFKSDEPEHNDEPHIKEEKLRRKALIQDAMLFENDEFWYHHIMARSATREHERHMEAKRKRSTADRFSMSGGARAKSRRADERGSPKRRQLMTPDVTPRKSKNGVKRSIEIEHISDDAAEEENEETDEARVERLRQTNVQKVKSNLPSITKCTIFVGNEYHPVIADRIAMGKCNLLTDWEEYSDELGSHIKLYEHVHIQKDRFETIAEYLRGGDFTPRLAKALTTDRFEDPVFLPESRDEAAQRVAMTYHTASKIQFWDVQRLCLRKLQLLDTLGPSCILVVARIVRSTETFGMETDDAMLTWLVEQISKQFYKLMEAAYMTLSRVMRDDTTLSKRVYEKLAEEPEAAIGGLEDE